MTKSSYKRYMEPLSPKASLTLAQLAKSPFLSKESLKEILKLAPSLGLSLSGFLLIVWLILNWLLGLFGAADFGLDSEIGSIIFSLICLFSFGYTFYKVGRCEGVSPELRRKLKKDCKNGTLQVTEYTITDLKVFEEPEHGGFLYFLLTSEDDVIAFFDAESQDLCIDGRSPLESTQKPKSVLKICRAPISKYIVDASFIGEELPFPLPLQLTSKTSRWPEDCEFVKCRWNKIEPKYKA